MGVKPWKSRHDLAVTLVNERGLNAKSIAEVEKHLQGTNYFQLVNGIENLLLTQEHPKKFTTESFDDFLRIYEFDSKLKNELFKIIEEFEERLKTSIAYNFSKNHCQGLNNTMQYTNKLMYNNIGNDPDYPFQSFQYMRIYHQFNDFTLFRANFLYNLIKTNDSIDKFFYQDTGYLPPRGVSVLLSNQHVAVPFWVAIQAQTFGTLLILIHYLKQEDLTAVLHDFGLRYSDRYQFLNALDIIKELRNKCAHGFLMERFKTPEYLKLNSLLVNRLNLTPYHRGRRATYPSTLYLADSLRVLGWFQNLKGLKKVFKALIYNNNKEFKQKSYDLNSRVLRTLGVSSYAELKNICV